MKVDFPARTYFARFKIMMKNLIILLLLKSSDVEAIKAAFLSQNFLILY